MLKTFQPGGASERATTLSALTIEKQAKDPRDAVEQLRKWKRHKLRAEELKVMLPDPSLMVGSLSRLVEGILISSPQANFRVNVYRMQSRIDIHPTLDSLSEFFTLLLAEMESLMLSPEAVDGGERTSKATPNVKAMQGDGREKGDKGGKGDKGSKLLCRSWGTPEGCRFGKACRFEHPVLADSRDRCWTCDRAKGPKEESPEKTKARVEVLKRIRKKERPLWLQPPRMRWAWKLQGKERVMKSRLESRCNLQKKQPMRQLC